MEKLFLILCLLSLVTVIHSETDLPKMNMTTDEMDKMLACAEIVTKTIQQYSEAYQKKTSSLGVNLDQANGKISSDMYSQCLTEIDQKSINYVNYCFKNSFSTT